MTKNLSGMTAEEVIIELFISKNQDITQGKEKPFSIENVKNLSGAELLDVLVMEWLKHGKILSYNLEDLLVFGVQLKELPLEAKAQIFHYAFIDYRHGRMKKENYSAEMQKLINILESAYNLHLKKQKENRKK